MTEMAALYTAIAALAAANAAQWLRSNKLADSLAKLAKDKSVEERQDAWRLYSALALVKELKNELEKAIAGHKGGAGQKE